MAGGSRRGFPRGGCSRACASRLRLDTLRWRRSGSVSLGSTSASHRTPLAPPRPDVHPRPCGPQQSGPSQQPPCKPCMNDRQVGCGWLLAAWRLPSWDEKPRKCHEKHNFIYHIISQIESFQSGDISEARSARHKAQRWHRFSAEVGSARASWRGGGLPPAGSAPMLCAKASRQSWHSAVRPVTFTMSRRPLTCGRLRICTFV